jgi:Asp/Glu/hydantoin racemase
VTDGSPTVPLIHATPAAIPPARSAFNDRFPRARLWNLLDDLLITEAEAAGGLTPPLRRRMGTLIRHAVDGGADAVLLSCSMYGPVAAEAATAYPLPVLASDQALFDAVTTRVVEGARRVAVLGPIRAGVDDTVARLRDWLTARDAPDATITGTVVDGVRAAAAAGDHALLEQLVVDEARWLEPDADVIVLGQFSISPAQPAVTAAVSVPVLSPPHLAADVLRTRLANNEATDHTVEVAG